MESGAGAPADCRSRNGRSDGHVYQPPAPMATTKAAAMPADFQLDRVDTSWLTGSSGLGERGTMAASDEVTT
jgi:hypothetical protein